jgi:thiopeptide-type bacteriocin biosynthesis protein
MSISIENNGSIDRTFITGDEWLYFKFYCGVNTADHLIRDFFYPVITLFNKKAIINSWFFIRYSDPDFHLRLRIHIPDKQDLIFIVDIINQYSKPFLEQGLIWKIQTDTYKREIERYGDKSIEQIEQIFCFDSLMVMNSLNYFTNDNDADLRWKFSLISLDSFNKCFHLEDEQLSVFYKNQVEYYAKEFGLNHILKVQLDKKFRNNRNNIEGLLNGNVEHFIIPFSELNQIKLSLCLPIISALITMSLDKTITIPIYDLISSCNHMMFNRIFRTKQRLYEFVMYYLLSKYYESLLAQRKYSNIYHQVIKDQNYG